VLLTGVTKHIRANIGSSLNELCSSTPAQDCSAAVGTLLSVESRIPQILLTSELGSRSNNTAFIIRILQKCCRKNGIVNILLQKKLFQRKKAKRIFRANKLNARPGKGQNAKNQCC